MQDCIPYDFCKFWYFSSQKITREFNGKIFSTWTHHYLVLVIPCEFWRNLYYLSLYRKWIFEIYTKNAKKTSKIMHFAKIFGCSLCANITLSNSSLLLHIMKTIACVLNSVKVSQKICSSVLHKMNFYCMEIFEIVP